MPNFYSAPEVPDSLTDSLSAAQPPPSIPIYLSVSLLCGSRVPESDKYAPRDPLRTSVNPPSRTQATRFSHISNESIYTGGGKWERRTEKLGVGVVADDGVVTKETPGLSGLTISFLYPSSSIQPFTHSSPSKDVPFIAEKHTYK